MNWVGGVTAPEAALQLLGQGGIPSIGLTSGGVFKAVKLEHVWVEAYVDYVPSRGVVNKVYILGHPCPKTPARGGGYCLRRPALVLCPPR